MIFDKYEECDYYECYEDDEHHYLRIPARERLRRWWERGRTPWYCDGFGERKYVYHPEDIVHNYTQIFSKEYVIDLSMIDPDVSQFTTMLLKLPRSEGKIEWRDDTLYPRQTMFWGNWNWVG